MISFGPIQFASAWVLGFLILLPIWWLVRRRRKPAAIVFSRVGVLATGPKAGRHSVLVGARETALFLYFPRQPTYYFGLPS